MHRVLPIQYVGLSYSIVLPSIGSDREALLSTTVLTEIEIIFVSSTKKVES